MAEWNGYYCTVLNYNIHTDMIIFCPEESEAAVSDCLPVHSSPFTPHPASMSDAMLTCLIRPTSDSAIA